MNCPGPVLFIVLCMGNEDASCLELYRYQPSAEMKSLCCIIDTQTGSQRSNSERLNVCAHIVLCNNVVI